MLFYYLKQYQIFFTMRSVSEWYKPTSFRETLETNWLLYNLFIIAILIVKAGILLAALSKKFLYPRLHTFTTFLLLPLLFYLLTKFHGLIPFIFWDIGQCVYFNICYPIYDVIKFEIKFSFLVNPVSYTIKKVGRKL